MLLDTYSTDQFNSLPFLGEALELLRRNNGTEVLDSSLKELFVRHGLTNRLGVCLVHRHFSINSDERLVETNGTSTPWSNAEVSDAHDEGGYIAPHMWTLINDQPVPLEFTFKPNALEPEDSYEDPLSGVDQPFFAEFATILREHHLSNVLGIAAISQDREPQVEITRGRANILLNLNDISYPESRNEFADVLWAYNQPSAGAPCEMRSCQVCKIIIPEGSSHKAHRCGYP